MLVYCLKTFLKLLNPARTLWLFTATSQWCLNTCSVGSKIYTNIPENCSRRLVFKFAWGSVYEWYLHVRENPPEATIVVVSMWAMKQPYVRTFLSEQRLSLLFLICHHHWQEVWAAGVGTGCVYTVWCSVKPVHSQIANHCHHYCSAYSLLRFRNWCRNKHKEKIINSVE